MTNGLLQSLLFLIVDGEAVLFSKCVISLAYLIYFRVEPVARPIPMPAKRRDLNPVYGNVVSALILVKITKLSMYPLPIHTNQDYINRQNKINPLPHDSTV